MSNLIKWTGRSTNGTWKKEVYADSMADLINELLSSGIITCYEGDFYDVEKVKKAGMDYDEFYDSFYDEDYNFNDEAYRTAIDELEELADSEIMLAMQECNSNAYYQTFEFLYEVTYRDEDDGEAAYFLYFENDEKLKRHFEDADEELVKFENLYEK